MNQMMTHPIHGTKFANSQKEIESDLLHGWVKYEAPVVTDSNTDDIVAKEVAVEVAVVVEDEPVIDEPVVDSFLKSLDKKKK